MQQASLKIFCEVVQDAVVVPDWSTFEILRTTSDGIEERAKMEKGPDGFIIGQFGKHVVVLDAPNLMLVSVPTSKKRPAANTMKKPAAADGSAEEKADDVDVAIVWEKSKQAHDPTLLTCINTHMNTSRQYARTSNVHCAFNAHHVENNFRAHMYQAITSVNYGIMWYKRDGVIGIREKFGAKKQVISFGSGTGKSETELREWADKCLTKLDKGDKVDDVLTWVKAQIQ